MTGKSAIARGCGETLTQSLESRCGKRRAERRGVIAQQLCHRHGLSFSLDSAADIALGVKREVHALDTETGSMGRSVGLAELADGRGY